MLSHKFSYTVRFFIENDGAYHFMNIMKGAPLYWKSFLDKVLAMVKQLGIPTFVMTLICANLHRNDLISNISKLKGERLQEEHIDNMNIFALCTYLKANPVLLA